MPRGHGPRLKSRNNKADYENRLRMVGRMAIRVITEGEIAMALGIDQATVSRDLDEIRQRNLKDIEEIAANLGVGDISESHVDVIPIYGYERQ